MSKLNELEKKRDRISGEIAKAEAQIKKQQDNVKAKSSELKRLESEIIAEYLVQNDLSFSDLKDLISSDNGNGVV